MEVKARGEGRRITSPGYIKIKNKVTVNFMIECFICYCVLPPIAWKFQKFSKKGTWFLNV
jgi:hypothetical protein